MASTRCIPLCSPARTFLSLSRPASSGATPTAALDFLLPPAARTAQRRGLHHGVAAVGARYLRRRIPQTGGGSSLRQARISAPFSTTSTLRATRSIFNPQQDEEGNEMLLEITPRAAKRLSDVMAKDADPYLALRIQIESGGCHGFQYLMNLVSLPPALPPSGPSATAASSPPTAPDSTEEPPIREDDTIFVFSPDGEDGGAGVAGEAGGDAADLTRPKIILDGPSLELLKGSKVDYTMELIGSQFKIVDNPLATSSCGCGTSFDIKF